jgi:hypothetical protein
MPEEVKTIGSSGQMIPDNERWLHTSDARSDLDQALELSDRTERSESDLNAFAREDKEYSQGEVRRRCPSVSTSTTWRH